MTTPEGRDQYDEVDFSPRRQEYLIDGGIKLTAEEAVVIAKYGVKPEKSGSGIAWYKDGKLHSYDDLPAYRNFDGTYMHWANDGQIHRAVGPGEITNCADGTRVVRYWSNNTCYYGAREDWLKSLQLPALKPGWHVLNGEHTPADEWHYQSRYKWVSVRVGADGKPDALRTWETAATRDEKTRYFDISNLSSTHEERLALSKAEEKWKKSIHGLIVETQPDLIADAAKEARPAPAPAPAPAVQKDESGNLHSLTESVAGSYWIHGIELTKHEWETYTKSGLNISLHWTGKGFTTKLENGQLHSVADLPCINIPGAKYWYNNGNAHRDCGPAVEGTNDTRFYLNGVIQTQDSWAKQVQKLHKEAMKSKQEKVFKAAIQREPGWLYYFDNGNIMRTKMSRGSKLPVKREEPEVVLKTDLQREDGFIYYLDKDGDVARSPTIHGKIAAPKTFDFGDGKGKVPAHKHKNGGGWVADTAAVSDTAYVGPYATVFGSAIIADKARLTGNAKVFGTARVRNYAKIFDGCVIGENAFVANRAKLRNTKLGKDATVDGSSSLVNCEVENMLICGTSRLTGINAGKPDELRGQIYSASLHTQAHFDQNYSRYSKFVQKPAEAAKPIVAEVQVAATKIVEPAATTNSKTGPSTKVAVGFFAAGTLLSILTNKMPKKNQSKTKPSLQVVKKQSEPAYSR